MPPRMIADNSTGSPLPDQRNGAREFEPKLLGARMKAVRRRKDMTLADLAAAANLDKGYLSRIENGQKSPTIASLLKIANSLGVPVGELIGETLNRDDLTVIKAKERVRLVNAQGEGLPLEVLVPASAATAFASFIYYPPDEASNPDYVDHSGEEMALVLAGKIAIEVADELINLEEGDAVFFAGGLRHRMRRVGRDVASVLVVVTKMS
jgi:transcriptional regulator with XRE-family HTH domain